MEVYTSTLIKGGLAVGVTSLVAVPAVVKGREIFSNSQGITVNTKITKWDEAVIKKIKTEGLQFNKTGDLSTFSGLTTTPKKITLSASMSKDNSLNTEQFTWECEIGFSKKDDANTQASLDTTKQGALFGSSDGGFFSVLQSSATNNKNLKIQFVENCAKSRTTKPNSLDENKKIKSSKDFVLEGENNLKIKDEEYDLWFEENLSDEFIKSISEDCLRTKNNNSCLLDQQQFKKIKILTEKDQEWDGNLAISGNGNMHLEWTKSRPSLSYFPLDWKISLKSDKPENTMKINTTEGKEEDEITIEHTNPKDFWLKEREGKYYLAQKLTLATKESKVGLTCTGTEGEITCQIAEEKLKGISNEASSTTLTIKKDMSNSEQYTVTGSSDDSGVNYEIVFENDNWTLKKKN